MKCSKEEFEKIVDALDMAGFDYRSYSGRGMYGEYCLGIDCDNVTKCIVDICIAIVNDENTDPCDLMELLRDARSDSMGLGAIVYFPNIPWFDKE